MRKIMACAAGILAAALIASPAAHADDEGEPIRILQLTGGGWHDYENQQTILSEGIGERVNAEFETFFHDGDVEEAEIAFFEDPEWIEGFDLVLYNTCWAANVEGGDGWVVENIIDRHLEHETPAVFIHCALHTYRHHGDAEHWHRFIGVSSFGHQAHEPFTVEALEPDHPIIADLPLPWGTPQGELYQIVDIFENTTPLTHSLGLGGDDDYHVNVWVNDYEGLRVFGTSIGHHNETMEHPVYLDMVSQGVLWAAGELE